MAADHLPCAVVLSGILVPGAKGDGYYMVGTMKIPGMLIERSRELNTLAKMTNQPGNQPFIIILLKYRSLLKLVFENEQGALGWAKLRTDNLRDCYHDSPS
ncbi:hypothetical protein [Kordiimonas aestuarii]|uniref:hypothetical protein n=1 Tax=Kordiimonas aestuarii TaxID=1005925 RepID=UPI0021D11092|nr:hypothetical protein [Kordiimonas aestuarii]